MCLLDESVCARELGFMCKKKQLKASRYIRSFYWEISFIKKQTTCGWPDHMKQQSETVHSEQNTGLTLELTVNQMTGTFLKHW